MQLLHSLQIGGAVCGSEPLLRGGPAGPGLHLWAGGWESKSCRMSGKVFGNQSAGRVKGRGSRQRPRAPVWGRARRAGGTSAGGRAGLDEKSRQRKTGIVSATTGPLPRLFIMKNKQIPAPESRSRDQMYFWTHRAAGREPCEERRTSPPAGPCEV